MLEVQKINVGYDGVPAVHEASFKIGEGEIVSIIGSNGAGKSTILRAISGLLKMESGTIVFQDQEVQNLPPHKIVELGISHTPEGRKLFGLLSVEKNLLLGAYTIQDKAKIRKRLEEVFELFPILRERKRQRSQTLSGGEQQMLAIARSLVSKPKLLLLDEPSLGLMPTLVAKIFETIKTINQQGMTLLLVEQNVREALELCNRGYVLQTGRIVMEGPGKELLSSDIIRKAYLGI
jgi:branched-chain amino acid transport system ATP-binding protein